MTRGLGSDATRRQIRAATIVWMASILASRVAGLLREIVVARAAGATGLTDVFFTAFTLPDFINYLLAGGALSITFIPIFTGFLVRGEDEEGWRVFSTVLTLLAITATLLLGAAMIFTEPLCRIFGRGFTPEQQVHLVRYTRILLPAQFCFFAGGLFGAALMARGRHRVAALSPLVYNLGIILGGLLLAPRFGVEGFCWGALAGALLGPLAFQGIGAVRSGLRYRPRLELGHPAVRQYLALTIPFMIGQSILVTDDWLVRYYGAFLPAASISWLNYAKKLALALPAVLGQASAVASFPTLAGQAERGEYGALTTTLREGVRRGIFLAMVGAALLVVLNREVTVLLLRGQRFTTSDALATGQALALLAPAIPAWVGQALLARGFYVLRNTWTPTLLGTALTLIGIPFYGLMARQGYLGLAAATSLSMLAYVVLLDLGLRRELRKRDATAAPLLGGGFLLRSLGLSALLLLVAALTRGALGRIWPDHTFGEALLRTGGVGVAAAIGLSLLARPFRLESEAVLPGLLRRLSARRGA